MFNPDHPATILTNAWSHVRLDVIRTAVASTLTQLEDMHPRSTPTSDSWETDGPATAARRACREEIREAAGECPDLQSVTSMLRMDDLTWRAAFEAELAKYRGAAAATLRTSLGPY